MGYTPAVSANCREVWEYVVPTTAITGHGGHWDDTPFTFDNHYYTSLMTNDWQFAQATRQNQEQWETVRNRDLLVMLDPDFSLKVVLSNPNQRSPAFSIIQFYAQNSQAWLSDFVAVWKKVTERGSGDLNDLCDDDDTSAACTFDPSTAVIASPPPPPPPKASNNVFQNVGQPQKKPAAVASSFFGFFSLEVVVSAVKEEQMEVEAELPLFILGLGH